MPIRLLEPSDNPSSDASEASLSRIEKLLALEVNERKVAAIQTWPFDTKVLGRLVAIILSVIAILLSQIIAIGLGL